MSKEDQQPEQLSVEALTAYDNSNVLMSVRSSDWFTPEFIREINRSEPYPDRDGLGPFKDKLLGDFLMAGALPKDYLTRDTNTAYLGTLLYLTQRTIGHQGHPYPLNRIEFVDEALLSKLAQESIEPNREVDRGMIFDMGKFLQCIIAPQKIRPQVVRALCGWSPTSLDRVKDVIAWSQVVRQGAFKFMTKRWSQ